MTTPASTRIGRYSVSAVLDSVVRPPAGVFYSNTPAELWAVHADLLTSDARVELFMGAYVLQGPDRIVLVDAGVGPNGWRAPSGAFIPGGFLLDSLRVDGIEPGAVTDVVFTHLHPDHIGWASSNGLPNFPNATYRCHRRDWAYFVEGGADAGVPRAMLEPLTERFDMWDGSGALFPGVDLVDTPGHTPGSTTLVLSGDDGSRAMLLGDVVHCPVELVDEEWETVADVDPALALETRARLARELDGTDTLVGAAHFPALRFGRLLQGESGRRWQPVS
jgi:glyoxylase-like metal-dependent hydrolase (beta-lactamase superfamily II)